MTGLEIAFHAARLADEKKGGDIVVYDLRGISDVADYFVVATAHSRLQIQAIAFGIEKSLKEQGILPLGAEGGNDSQWMLLDYVDAVLHVFSPEMRKYYGLESLWGDAPKLEWNVPDIKKEAVQDSVTAAKPTKRKKRIARKK